VANEPPIAFSAPRFLPRELGFSSTVLARGPKTAIRALQDKLPDEGFPGQLGILRYEVDNCVRIFLERWMKMVAFESEKD